jgi:HK97 family phage major capsid protein
MSEWINRLAEEHRSIVATAQTMVEKAAEETRDLSDTEKASHSELEKRAAVLADQIERLAGEVKAKNRIDALVSGLDRVEVRERPTDPRETRSVGEQFVESQEFAAWSGRGQSAGVVVETRSLLTLADPAGLAGGNAQTVAGVVPVTRTPLYDAISKIPVTSNAVEYPVFTPAWVAGKVAEGAPKPEAGTFTLANKTLEKWAHWKKMSREFRQDKGYLAAVVDQQLVEGVRRAAELAAVTAVKGTTTTAVTDADFGAAVRLGIAGVESAGGMATHVLLNPADAAALDIAAAAGAHIGYMSTRNPWGLTIISSPGATAGTGVVFDSDAVVAYVRTGIETFMTDSDITDGTTVKSDFRSNILTVLAEARGLVALQVPALAVPVSVTAP